MNLFYLLNGGLVNKTKDHALCSLLPKRDDDEMPNTNFPHKGFRHSIIKYPNNRGNVDNDLNEGGHGFDCNWKFAQ
jgi:hypothetical protein